MARSAGKPCENAGRMSISAHFNVPTAGVLVLGGIGALVLATTIALRGSDRHSGDRVPAASHAGPGGSATLRPAAGIGGAPLETEVEYPLDPSD